MNYNKTEMNERAFSFIYGCALRDAILQKAFIGKKDWIADVTSAQGLVKEYIDKVLNGEFKRVTDKEEHEKAFLLAARNICNAINQNRPSDAEDTFSFGNAQKLINIVSKHVYAHTYSLHFLGETSIRDNFRFCHCPMDSIMLLHVWREYEEAFGAECRKNDLGKDFLKSWGSEDFDIIENEIHQPDRYVRYQKAIERLKGTEIFPIEYDYLIWKNEQSIENQ
jgi:hypothetical protein